MTWIYMALLLVALATNLFWPRRRVIQVAALIALVFAAWLHGSILAGMNPHARALAAVERHITGEWPPNNELAVSSLRSARAIAKQIIFDVSLGLTLGIAFAIIPPDALSRIARRSARAEHFKGESVPRNRAAS